MQLSFLAMDDPSERGIEGLIAVSAVSVFRLAIFEIEIPAVLAYTSLLRWRLILASVALP